MPAPTATQEGVVSRRTEAMRDVLANREAQIDQELKDSGVTAGIDALQRDDVAGDPLRPADVPEDDWNAMSDEQKNTEITRAKEAKPAPEVVETEEEKTAREEAEAAAAAPKKVKIKVDGVETEVDESTVLQAGVATLQKEKAADKRLEEAGRIKEEAERLQAAAAKAAAAAPAEQRKKTDQEILAEKDALKPIVKAIQYGDEETAAAALFEYGQKMAQLGQANALTAVELNDMLDLREAQHFVKANYADVMGDEKLKKLFVSDVNAKLAAGDARPYQEICKEVGDELRTWKGVPASTTATPAKPAAGASRAAVHERKTTTVQVPSAAARQPAPTQPKAESATDTVAKMRADRERQAGRTT